MKIGYYVQGGMDETVVRGLARRWCSGAELVAGPFRGSSRQSFRREIERSLIDLKDDKECKFLVVLTDADTNRWQHVKRRESGKVPEQCRHLTLFGVADRNIECWLATDRGALAGELGCRPEDIPTDDPSDFVKRRFGLSDRTRQEAARKRVSDYVAGASLKPWIDGSPSFQSFYDDARALAQRAECPSFPNERET